MAHFKPAGTVRGLQNQESRLNAEITTYNLALDRLETAGIDNPDRSIDDTLMPIESGVYESIQAQLDTALDNRRTVQSVLTELGMQTHPAAVDNRK